MQVPGIGDGPLHAGGRLPQDRRRRRPARPHLDPPRELPGRAGSCSSDLGFEPGRARATGSTATRAAREAQGAVARGGGRPAATSGAPTLRDILDALARPGRDPREDLPPPIFKKGILKLEDLQPGMELKGTVLNVVDFGAFVDIGLKDSGLVHISQMANRYVKSPYDVVAVGDVVTVWVLKVDAERRPGVADDDPAGHRAKPPERRPPQRERGPGPVRRPAPAPATAAAAAARGPSLRGGAPPSGPRPGSQAGAQTRGRSGGPPPRRRRPAPERKPPKPRPLPQLTQAKREGKAYLTTLGELEAFFKAREEQPPPSASAVRRQPPAAPASPRRRRTRRTGFTRPRNRSRPLTIRPAPHTRHIGRRVRRPHPRPGLPGRTRDASAVR